MPRFSLNTARSAIPWHAAFSIAAGLALWEMLSRAGFLPVYLFPGPSLVGTALLEGLRSGEMLPQVAVTLRHLATGFLCGSLAGLCLASLCVSVKPADNFIEPWINAALPLPQFAFLPLYLMLFGAREWLPAVVAALGAFFSVFVSLRAGLLKTDRTLLEAARSLGADRLGVLREVMLPSAIPYLIVGMHLGALNALRLVIVTEAILSMRGMGHALWLNGEWLRTAHYYAYIVLLACIGIVIVFAFKRLAAFFVPWGDLDLENC